MGRGDVLMMTAEKKRSKAGYFVAALLLFALLYVAQDTLLRRSRTPAPVSIPTNVGAAVERAYNGLDGGFRGKVSLAEFAGMFHRMADPDMAGELPDVRQAGVTDAPAPEHPVARFRVDYPAAKVKAEYHFERIEGLWQLQSFTRIPTELDAVPRGKAASPSPRRPEAGKEAPAPKAGGGDAASPSVAGRPATPCDYVVQPGDTLSGLAQRFYGASRHWRRILEANPGLTERNLRVGRRIRIPSSPEPAPPREEPDAEPKAALSTP
jgi:phage tail protein X